MGTNQTSHEEVTVKENTRADLRCNLRTENSETSKELTFVIEIRLCDNGKYHDVCRCRWLPDKDAVCKNQRNVSICEADNNEMRFSLFVKRTYSDILWELYRPNLTPVVLKKTKLQVICEKFYFPDAQRIFLNKYKTLFSLRLHRKHNDKRQIRINKKKMYGLRTFLYKIIKLQSLFYSRFF